jgi:hypothetical protein
MRKGETMFRQGGLDQVSPFRNTLSSVDDRSVGSRADNKRVRPLQGELRLMLVTLARGN